MINIMTREPGPAKVVFTKKALKEFMDKYETLSIEVTEDGRLKLDGRPPVANNLSLIDRYNSLLRASFEDNFPRTDKDAVTKISAILSSVYLDMLAARDEQNNLHAEKLREIKQFDKETGDTEVAHAKADDVLTELLLSLGYEKVVNAYNKVPKWYA